jgi:hypothetical protein
LLAGKEFANGTAPFSPAENLEDLSEGGVRVERPILDLTKS